MSHPVIQSVSRAAHNILAPGMPKIFALSMTVTLLGLLLFAGGISMSLGDWLEAKMAADQAGAELPWIFSAALTIGIGLFVSSVIWMFFPLLLPLVISFFDEKIAEKIEQHEYPKLAIGTPAPFWQDLRADLWLVGKAVLLNILFFPFFFVPLLGQIFYWVMNGYLVGSSFFVMAGGRHVGKAEAIKILHQHRMSVLLAGMLIVGCAVVPVLNLVAPFWGVAIMVHLYQHLNPPSIIISPHANDVSH